MARNVARKDWCNRLKSIFLAKWRKRWRERAETSVMVYIISPHGEVSGEKDVYILIMDATIKRRLLSHKPVSVCWRAFFVCLLAF